MIVIYILLIAIFTGIPPFIRRYPETLSVYNGLSPERKKQVDLPGLVKFYRIWLYLCAAIPAVGLSIQLCGFGGEEKRLLWFVFGTITFSLVGALWGVLKYDGRYNRQKK